MPCRAPAPNPWADAPVVHNTPHNETMTPRLAPQRRMAYTTKHLPNDPKIFRSVRLQADIRRPAKAGRYAFAKTPVASAFRRTFAGRLKPAATPLQKWRSARRGVRIEKTAGRNGILQPNGHGLSAVVERRVRRDEAVSERSKGVTEETVVGRRAERELPALNAMRVVVVVDRDRIAGVVVPACVAPVRRAKHQERRDEQRGRASGRTAKRTDGWHQPSESTYGDVGLSKNRTDYLGGAMSSPGARSGTYVVRPSA